MKEPVKMLVALVVLAVFAGIFYLFPTSQEGDFPDQLGITEKADLSAGFAINWLINYENEYKDPGVIWVLDMVNNDYCDSGPLRNLITDKFKEFEDHPVEFAYKKLIDKNFTFDIDYEVLKEREKFFDDIIMPTVYCSDSEMKKETLEKIFDIENVSNYDLTHRFLAMLIIQKNGCSVDPEYGLDKHIVKAKNKIIEEQNKSRKHNDIYSERVAFLLFGGFNADVKEEWINEIIESQSPEGAWSDPQYFGRIDNPHTTALSLWALANYTQKCPL